MRQRAMSPKVLHIMLFALCGVFAIVAALLFLSQWIECTEAARNAEILLNVSEIKPTVSSSAEPGPNGQTPAADTAESTLPAELQGYLVIARLDIDALDLHLPVLSQTTDKALKVSVCYYEGPLPGGEGNLVITGHNYRSGAHFGRLNDLKTGDTVQVSGTSGKTYYTVYKIDHIKPDDARVLNDTVYTNELSLLTCESSGNGRLLVRCRMNDEQKP